MRGLPADLRIGAASGLHGTAPAGPRACSIKTALVPAGTPGRWLPMMATSPFGAGHVPPCASYLGMAAVARPHVAPGRRVALDRR